jgi:copper chaperone CopZ
MFAAIASMCFFVTFGGLARAEEETAKVPARAVEAPAETQYRRIQMRLSGSSCVACLHELEKKFRNISGVQKCKIDYPGENLYQAVPGAGWALATIVADVNRVSVQQMVQFMKTQGYHAFKIIDKGPA